MGLIFSGLVPNLVSRPLHMTLALPWVFLFTADSRTKKLSDGLLCAAGIAACLYIVLNHEALGDQYGTLSGPLQLAVIASIILCAGIVIGVLGMTGLGVKLTSLILSASGNILWPAFGLTALACLVLGMEVPTTAAYVICVSVAGPALRCVRALQPGCGIEAWKAAARLSRIHRRVSPVCCHWARTQPLQTR